jgi:deoxyribose-phosphate aldolase
MSDLQPDRKSPHDLAIGLAGRIQSTLISNCVTRTRWEEHVAECLQYRFQAAMVPPAWVEPTVAALIGSGIRVASFIDLPRGTMTSAGKTDEARHLIQDGVEEIDLMPNVGFLVSRMENAYFEDIRGVVHAAGKVPIKIMLELPLLSAQQRDRAVALSIDAGVAYLKNASSGAVGVATTDQIRYLRSLAPPHIRVKASGGIKSARQVQELLAAGADLVGTSTGGPIIRELLGEAESASVKGRSNY